MTKFTKYLFPYFCVNMTDYPVNNYVLQIKVHKIVVHIKSVADIVAYRAFNRETQRAVRLNRTGVVLVDGKINDADIFTYGKVLYKFHDLFSDVHSPVFFKDVKFIQKYFSAGNSEREIPDRQTVDVYKIVISAFGNVISDFLFALKFCKHIVNLFVGQYFRIVFAPYGIRKQTDGFDIVFFP